MSIDEALAKLTARRRVPFRPARATDLWELQELGAPPSLVAFYAAHEPESVNSGIYTIDEILSSTRHCYPGSIAFPFGYLPIGDNECGDKYLVDLKSPRHRIVILSHETIGVGTTQEEVDAEANEHEVAGDFTEFLEKRAAGQLE